MTQRLPTCSNFSKWLTMNLTPGSTTGTLCDGSIFDYRTPKAINASRLTSGNTEHNRLLEPEEIRFARRFRRPDPETVQFAQNIVQLGGSVSLASRLVRSQIESIQDKNLHNALATISRREMGRLSKIAALLTKLENSTEHTAKYTFENGKLQDVFWARNSHFSLADKCPEVVIAGSIYRTNHLDLPCLVVDSVDENQNVLDGNCATKSRIYPCIYMVISDSDPVFISVIRNVIPLAQHQLCAWHIAKDMQVHLSRKVENYKDFAKESTKLFSSQTPDEFDKHYNKIIQACPNTAD
ncbi:uncharacterized protein VTP21DRAFT_8836 [Calcarisporiella thermophila]|uniref:uncharacterized protein n=1 Tax=Calcarisporiella thermophila TaxID=911321 RepID=UPI003744446A